MRRLTLLAVPLFSVSAVALDLPESEWQQFAYCSALFRFMEENTDVWTEITRRRQAEYFLAGYLAISAIETDFGTARDRLSREIDFSQSLFEREYQVNDEFLMPTLLECTSEERLKKAITAGKDFSQLYDENND